MWLAALPAAVAATSPDVDEADATICARVLLAKLAVDPGAAPAEVRRFGREAVAEEHSEAVFRFFTGWYRLTSPVPAALECLVKLGAVQRDRTGAALTPLGRWGLWDDDHLHQFTVGRNRYGDPFYTPELANEERLRLGAAFASTDTITYRYDFGACWDHTVRCEKVLDSLRP